MAYFHTVPRRNPFSMIEQGLYPKIQALKSFAVMPDEIIDIQSASKLLFLSFPFSYHFLLSVVNITCLTHCFLIVRLACLYILYHVILIQKLMEQEPPLPFIAAVPVKNAIPRNTV